MPEERTPEQRIISEFGPVSLLGKSEGAPMDGKLAVEAIANVITAKYMDPMLATEHKPLLSDEEM